MKAWIGIGVLALIAVGRWSVGGEIRPDLAAASTAGTSARVLLAQGFAPTAIGQENRSMIELTASELKATQSEDWVLPRDGTRTLRLESEGKHIRCRLRFTGMNGEAIAIRVVREARAETEAEARERLGEMKVERRREGDDWIVTATWPHRPVRRRIGAHTTTYDDPRVVAFEIHLPPGVRLDLSRLNLVGADLDGQDLRTVRLSGLSLVGASLVNADLSGMDLSGTSLVGANLRGADLRNASLTGARLKDADLTDAKLEGASLAGVNAADLIGVLSGAGRRR